VPPVKGKRQTRHPPLATIPALVAELHPHRNDDLDPQSISLRSNHKLWWRCASGHDWIARLSHRTEAGSGCPYCAHTLPTPGYNLAVLFPAVCADWDVERNGELRPTEVLPKSSRPRLWWRCGRGHRWQATPLSRTVLGTGCPQCAQSTHRGNRLIDQHPDLVTEWLAELNPVTFDAVIAGSKQLRWWRCSSKPAHWWRATPYHRSLGTGCPFCRGHRRSAADGLAATYFEAVAYCWHPTRNGALSPTEVASHDPRRFWWTDVPGHDVRATAREVQERLEGG